MTRIRTLTILLQASGIGLLCGSCLANVAVTESGVEPDDYDDSTVLTYVNPLVDMFIFNGKSTDNAGAYGFPEEFGQRLPFPVLSLTDTQYAPTGSKVFGLFGASFTPLSRSIGLKFNRPVSLVSVEAMGEVLLSTYGILEAYDSTGDLIESVSTGDIKYRNIRTVEIASSDGDIAFARFFSSPDGAPYGRFDNLRFAVVPEPTTLTLVFFALCMPFLRQR